jgi:transposase
VDAHCGDLISMIAPTVNTDLMNTFLEGLSALLSSDEHGVVLLDNAGWHVCKQLRIPENLTLRHLPPYSPELNPVERLWGYLRSHHLSNRAYADYRELFDHADAAFQKLGPDLLKTLCAASWLSPT